MAASSPPPDALISPATTRSYWASIPPTNHGMLGGLPQISRTDLLGSAAFLAKLRKGAANSTSATFASTPLPLAVDCGAGIGRITAGLLSKTCCIIDIVEPIASFADKARNAALVGNGRIGEVYVTGLEDWTPSKLYDLIWNQWCLSHLPDTAVVEYLMRCIGGLREGGWVVVKENVVGAGREEEDIYDHLDSSVTRTDAKFRKLFNDAGWKVVRSELQAGFPRGLYPVRSYALQPKGYSKA